jgi:hypothetical protein
LCVRLQYQPVLFTDLLPTISIDELTFTVSITCPRITDLQPDTCAILTFLFLASHGLKIDYVTLFDHINTTSEPWKVPLSGATTSHVARFCIVSWYYDTDRE